MKVRQTFCVIAVRKYEGVWTPMLAQCQMSAVLNWEMLQVIFWSVQF